MNGIEFKYEWDFDPEEREAPEQKHSMARFSLWVNGECYTESRFRYSDGRVGEVEQVHRFPMYNLAVWLGWNFYRHLHEPPRYGDTRDYLPFEFIGNDRVDDRTPWEKCRSWFVAHNMDRIIDHDGFVWPSVRIEPDAEDGKIRISSIYHREARFSPFEHLSHRTGQVSAKQFQEAVMSFIIDVAERMEARKPEAEKEGNDLLMEVQKILGILQDDAQSEEQSALRIVEAEEGYDINEMPLSENIPNDETMEAINAPPRGHQEA